MSININEIAKRYQAAIPEINFATSAARSMMDEQERWRKQMLGPMSTMQSIVEEQEHWREQVLGPISTVQSMVEEQERWRKQMLGQLSAVESILEEQRKYDQLQRDMLQNLFPSHAKSEVDGVLKWHSEIDRILDALKPSLSVMDAIHADHGLTKQIALLSEPWPGVIEQLRLEQVQVATPWASQIGSAAEYARKLLNSLPMEDPNDETLDLTSLSTHLNQVHGAMSHLPLKGDGSEAVYAKGMSVHQWVMCYMAIIATLAALVTVYQAQLQMRFAREQALGDQTYRAQSDADLAAFRERLFKALDDVAAHAPVREDLYVVGLRPARVRSAITGGALLDIAHPNQIVTATGKEGRWLKVRYRNHLEDREVEGWVLKHYLIRQAAAESEN